MKKFRNKYRIESARLQNWNYQWAAAYFITICTHNRQHYFGEIKNDKMELSPIGIIADILWYEIKNHAKNVELGSFIVMPNHIHGILIITQNPTGDIDIDAEAGHAEQTEAGHALPLQLPHTLPLHHQQPLPQSSDSTPEPPKTIGQKRFQNIGKNSVSSIIGSYKSAVTKHARRLGFEFHWQTLFHDRIIRDDKSFQNISNYINNNPAKWQEDKFFE